MLDLIVVTLAASSAVLVFWAIWRTATTPKPEEEDDNGFDVSAARCGYLHDKRGL